MYLAAAECPLESIEEATIVLGFEATSKVGDLFEKSSLFGCKPLGHDDTQVNVEISAMTTVDMRHSRPAQAKDITRLGACDHFDIVLLAKNGGNRHPGAEHCLEDRDRQLDVEIVTVTGKEIVVIDRHDDVEIARRASERASFAFAR